MRRLDKVPVEDGDVRGAWKARPPTDTPNAQLHREQRPPKKTWKQSDFCTTSKREKARIKAGGWDLATPVTSKRRTSPLRGFHHLRETQKLELLPEEGLKSTWGTPAFKTCAWETSPQNIQWGRVNRAHGHATHGAIRSLWCGSEFHSDLPASGPAPSGWWTLWERLICWSWSIELEDRFWFDRHLEAGGSVLWVKHWQAPSLCSCGTLAAGRHLNGGRWTPARCSSSHHGPPSAVCSSAKASACSGVGLPATAALRLLNISWLWWLRVFPAWVPQDGHSQWKSY